MSDEKIDELIDKLTDATQIIYDVANNSYGTVTNEQGQVATVVKVMDDLKFFNPRGAWITGEDYLTKDTFTNGDNVYTALIDHESGVFATDLADGKIATYQNIDTTTQAQIAADEAAASAASTAADVVTTNNNVTATNADVITTGNDATTTNNNVIITNNDVIATNEDATTTGNNVIITNNNVVSTNADVTTTNNNVTATNNNVTATNADVVTTNNNVTSTNADVITAGDSATAAAASAAAAALYDPAWGSWVSITSGWATGHEAYGTNPLRYRISADSKLLHINGVYANTVGYSTGYTDIVTLPAEARPTYATGTGFVALYDWVNAEIGQNRFPMNMNSSGVVRLYTDSALIAGSYFIDQIVALD